MPMNYRYLEARRVTLITIIAAILLGIIKVTVGFLGRSHALIADGVHSFSDLATHVMVLLATKYGSQAADSNHPYGHHRIETAAAVALAILLIVVGIGIVLDASLELTRQETLESPNFSVILVAFLSVILNECLYRYTKRVAHNITSDLLHANAWHSRSDAASSLVVLLGVFGAWLGFGYLDEVAAIIVGAMISKMGWDVGWVNLRELVDTGVDMATLKTIEQIIRDVPGVRNIHELRSRLMGGKILVDVHVQVNPRLSVSEGHYIGEQVRLTLMAANLSMQDVIVHIDPEADEERTINAHLPSRQEVLTFLEQRWAELPGFMNAYDLRLHYLGGRIAVEVYLPIWLLEQSEKSVELTHRYRDSVKDIAWIATITLVFKG